MTRKGHVKPPIERFELTIFLRRRGGTARKKGGDRNPLSVSLRLLPSTRPLRPWLPVVAHGGQMATQGIATRLAAQGITFTDQGGKLERDRLCALRLIPEGQHHRNRAAPPGYRNRLPLRGVDQHAKLAIGNKRNHGQHGRGTLNLRIEPI